MPPMAHDGSGAPFRSSIPTLLNILGISFLLFLSRSAMSPLLLAVEEQFSLTHARISRAFAMYTVGYGITVFLSGFVSRRITHRRLMPLAAAVAACGMVIVSMAPSVLVLEAGLFVFGVGFGLQAPTAISMITAVVRRSEWQRALSLHEVSPHLGMIIAPLGVVALRSVVEWRGVFVLLALLLSVQAILFALRVRAGNENGEAPSFEALAALVRKPAFWLLILFFALALASTDGVYLLIPTYLVIEAGLDQATANTIFGVSRILPIAALFASAFVFDRLGPRRTIAFSVAGAGVSVLVMGLTTGVVRLAMVFLQPSLGALYFPAGFAALSGLSPGKSRNVGISMVLPLAVIFGVGVVPTLVGQMGDTVSFGAGFVILGTTMTLLGPTALLVNFDGP